MMREEEVASSVAHLISLVEMHVAVNAVDSVNGQVVPCAELMVYLDWLRNNYGGIPQREQPRFRLGQRVRYRHERCQDFKTGVITRRLYEGTIVRVPSLNPADDWAKRSRYGVRIAETETRPTTIFNAYEAELESLT
jgi:hypothetical protein